MMPKSISRQLAKLGGLGSRTADLQLRKILALLLFLAGTGLCRGDSHWVGSWAASQQPVEPANSLPPDDLKDATLRQVVHLSIGGEQLRVHISNRFGSGPLHLTSVHVAQPLTATQGKILEATDKVLTFSGMADVTIPAGADCVSDPLEFHAAPLSDLTITFHIDASPSSQTGHPGSRATSYIVHGDLVGAADVPQAKKVEHWYFISGVDVLAPSDAATIAVLGDSITDGHGATVDGNDRWTDALARRLQAVGATQTLGVLNEGIGGNRLLLDGLGPNALARLDHDVLAQAGVRYLVVLEGINDIGMLTHDGEVPQAQHNSLVRDMIAAYEQIVARAHAHGINVIGATLLPFVDSQYYHPGRSSEADRQAVNCWIRAPGHFDSVIDFDQLTRDPQHPDRLLPAFDSGDHLHPSLAGYAAMAEAVPLSAFARAQTVATSALRIAITFDEFFGDSPMSPDGTPLDLIETHAGGYPSTGLRGLNR